MNNMKARILTVDQSLPNRITYAPSRGNNVEKGWIVSSGSPGYKDEQQASMER